MRTTVCSVMFVKKLSIGRTHWMTLEDSFHCFLFSIRSLFHSGISFHLSSSCFCLYKITGNSIIILCACHVMSWCRARSLSWLYIRRRYLIRPEHLFRAMLMEGSRFSNAEKGLPVLLLPAVDSFSPTEISSKADSRQVWLYIQVN